MTLGEPHIRAARFGAEKYPLPCPESKHDSSACRDQLRCPITVYEKPDKVFGKIFIRTATVINILRLKWAVRLFCHLSPREKWKGKDQVSFNHGAEKLHNEIYEVEWEYSSPAECKVGMLLLNERALMRTAVWRHAMIPLTELLLLRTKC
jgi:hypothetical protein